MPRYNASEQSVIDAGTCGVVVTDGENRVRKIAKDLYFIDPYEFPWEYCVAMVTKSPHIITVIEESFTAYEVSNYYAAKEKRKILKPTTYNNKKYVPSFQQERCEVMPWSKLPLEYRFSNSNNEKLLYDMVYALDNIHKDSGISILDINGGNIFMCPNREGQLKFGDLGFVRFFRDADDALKMMFGTPILRSPWAIAWHTLLSSKDYIELKVINKIKLKKLFYAEYEAYDFWTIGIIYIDKVCGEKGNTIGKYYNNIYVPFKAELKILKETGRLNEQNIYKAWESYHDKIFKDPEILTEKCENVRDVLLKLLQIDPVKRLEGVEDLKTINQ